MYVCMYVLINDRPYALLYALIVIFKAIPNNMILLAAEQLNIIVA